MLSLSLSKQRSDRTSPVKVTYRVVSYLAPLAPQLWGEPDLLSPKLGVGGLKQPIFVQIFLTLTGLERAHPRCYANSSRQGY